MKLKRTWIYNPETREMEEVGAAPKGERFHRVLGDVNDFVSPITGKKMSDRGQIRHHLAAHGVAPAADVAQTAERARTRRAAEQKHDRIQSLVSSYEHTRNALRSKQRFG